MRHIKKSDLKYLYQLFLEYLKEDYSKITITSISDYMVWLKKHDLKVGDSGSYVESYAFKVDIDNHSSIVDSVIEKIRQYSVAGLSTNTDVDRLFDTRCHDLEVEYEYQEAVDNDDINWKWLDDENNKLGLCRIYNRNEYDDVLSVFFTDYYLTIHPDFEKKLLQSDKAKHMSFVDIQDGQVAIVDDQPMFYIEEHLIKEILKDLDDIVEKLSVLYCSGSLFDSVDGDHNGYFVLSGYNPTSKCGDGWIIDSFAPH